MKNNTFTTTLREVFTPSFDPTIGQAYTGNHSGYFVSFWRNGDSVTVNHFGEKGLGPVRPLLKSETHSIEGLLSGLIAFAQDNGGEFDCKDDLPEGFSLPL